MILETRGCGFLNDGFNASATQMYYVSGSQGPASIVSLWKKTLGTALDEQVLLDSFVILR